MEIALLFLNILQTASSTASRGSAIFFFFIVLRMYTQLCSDIDIKIHVCSFVLICLPGRLILSDENLTSVAVKGWICIVVMFKKD